MSEPRCSLETPDPSSVAAKSLVPAATGVPERSPVSAGGLGRDYADDRRCVLNGWQQLWIDAELPSQKRAPGVGPRVEEIGAGGVRFVHGAPAGQPEIDVILWHQQRRRASERFGLVASDPLQLEAGPGDGGRIGGQRPEGIDIVGSGESANLRSRPLVVPELNRIEREFTPGVDQHSPVHLAAGSDR